MLSKTIQKAFDTQINNELESAYLYLAMSSYCIAGNYHGFSKWLRMQAQEELGHGMKLFDYVHQRGGLATLVQIEKPSVSYKNLLDVFKDVLEHEKKVTGLIHKLYEMTMKENDYASQIELQWFITEQVEEEQTAMMIVEQLKMIGDNKAALMIMDKEMAGRTMAA